MAKLTRAVARALESKGVRMRILQDLKSAPYLEHKLEFQDYIAGERGGILRSAVRQRSDLEADEIDELIAATPELEFYMPVTDHRRTWSGDDDILIATLLDESQSPLGFDVHGRAVDLDPESPPDVPVLVLVPVETDFTSPIDRRGYANEDDVGGDAIGEYRRLTMSRADDQIAPCTGCGGGSGGGSSGARVNWDAEPHGIYLDRTWYQEMGESWSKGEPELEVFTAIQESGGSEGSVIRCVAESQIGTRKYVQNSNFWTAQSSTDDVPQIATQQQVSDLPADRGFLFIVYDDDDQTCTVRDDDDHVNNALDLASTVQDGLDGIDQDDETDLALQAIATLIQIFPVAASLIETNDDIIGFIMEEPCTDPDGNSHNHTVLEGNETNGCVTLEGNF